MSIVIVAATANIRVSSHQITRLRSFVVSMPRKCPIGKCIITKIHCEPPSPASSWLRLRDLRTVFTSAAYSVRNCGRRAGSHGRRPSGERQLSHAAPVAAETQAPPGTELKQGYYLSLAGIISGCYSVGYVHFFRAAGAPLPQRGAVSNGERQPAEFGACQIIQNFV
jgi:hypothetical protein